MTHDKLIEVIAKAMCYVDVGDPHATTVQPGVLRWHWYRGQAEQFASTYKTQYPELRRYGE